MAYFSVNSEGQTFEGHSNIIVLLAKGISDDMNTIEKVIAGYTEKSSNYL